MAKLTEGETRPKEEPSKDEKRPLDGVRVIDLTRAAATPFATLILGLLGAEVIKIEEPGEAQQRRSGFSPDATIDSKSFIQMNHEKKSVALNLKTEMGVEICKELVKKADVFIEDMTLGVAERLGLGYDALNEVNPRIIYASNKGFGRSGPYKDYRAFDATVQCMAGAPWVNGYPESPPCKVGPAIGDWATGIYMALGIVAALRMRDATGKGRLVETSMQEAVASLLIDHYQMYQQSGIDPGRRGNAPYAPRMDLQNPKAMYQCKDGYMYILCGDDKQWELLMKVLGREDLKIDPRFADRYIRCENRDAIDEIIDEWTKDKTRDEVFSIMGPAGITCGKVLSLPETLEDPHMNQRGFFKVLGHPKAGDTKVFGLPLKFSDAPTDARIPCPVLGQDTEEVLTTVLGYAKDDLTNLREVKVIG